MIHIYGIILSKKHYICPVPPAGGIAVSKDTSIDLSIRLFHEGANARAIP
jgi:hypothetical protein